MKRFLSSSLIAIMVFSLAACTQTTSDDSSESAQTPAVESESQPAEESESQPAEGDQALSFDAGKYTGTAEGHNGSLEVEVEVSEDAILSVTILDSVETEHLTRVAYVDIPAQIVETQSVAVDSVTGATVTSSALKTAVTEALKQANGDMDLLTKAPEKQESTEVVELTTDVVVVGGGVAGASAALAAEQKGLSVILLEKNAMLGGHTALSGGITLASNSEFQRNLGVTDDTPEKFYADVMKNGGDKSVPELLKVYTEYAGVSTDWSVDYVGAKVPDKLSKFAENAVDRGLVYVGLGAGLMDSYAAKLDETTVDVHLDTRAMSLLTDDTGVIGVEAKGKDGTTYKISAKSTVLATGGYGARKDMLPEELQKNIYYGAALSSGDGIEMGEAVGADTVNMGYVERFENGVEWMPGIAKSTYYGSMSSWDVSGILVDRSGKRVVNERGPGTAIVAQQSAQPDGTLFLLMDQATFTHFSDNIGGTGISAEMLESWVENNGKSNPLVAHGATVEEAANIIGIDAEALKQTIETYNGYVAAGVDAEFGRDAAYMTAEIGEGPYYLVEQKARYATTLGGLLVNPDLQVINTDGAAINGLYAVGDTAGGVRGDDSISGSDVGWAIASGYMIGEILSKDAAN